MTNQAAATILKKLEQSLDDYCKLNDECIEAFYMAITALELFENSEQLQNRKKGKWIYNENGIDWNLPAWTCSECHCRNDNIPTVIKFGNKYERIAAPGSWQGSRFCPNCGADMRGTGDNSDE